MIIGDMVGIISRFKNLFQNNDEISDYEKGLAKTSAKFVGDLNKLSKKYKKVDNNFFEDLEELLIGADIGIETVNKFINRLMVQNQTKKMNLDELKKVIVMELINLYGESNNEINYQDLTVILFVGVNGSGKTTSLVKLALKLKTMNKKVLIIAGDTFRAGAIEQLNEWGDRIGVDVVSKTTSDPASVIYDGLEQAKTENYDVVLIDTAGRLQKKDHLMAELKKMNHVIGKVVAGAPHETLLVIDATTGQNGISQAKSFKEIANITGIVLTKVDGTAKGGIVIAIKDVTDIPVKLIGFGEKKEDLKVFELEKYIYGLFKEWEDEV